MRGRKKKGKVEEKKEKARNKGINGKKNKTIKKKKNQRKKETKKKGKKGVT